jgi:uncharacterized membrane protein
VLRQPLQWHHMVSDVGAHAPHTVAGLEVNTMADGFIHLFSWFVVVGASVVTLAQWRQGRLAPSWTFHVGGLLGWDLAFLGFGAALVIGGWLLLRRGRTRLAGSAR